MTSSPSQGPGQERIVILGAAGRDFHNFNVAFRGRADAEVVAFTAAQIEGIAGRRYPASLAGPLYPGGIAIEPEERLAPLVKEQGIDTVILAYSDLPHVEVMHKASIALAAGASFSLMGPRATMLRAPIPVVAVCAVRTGAGKSPCSRWIVRWALEHRLKPAVVRHPMPYGDLERQAVQRFASYRDLDEATCTIEELEEYEPYVRLGVPVFAGVDYGSILALAAQDGDFILWDGGNNDFPFYKPDLLITLLDPLRPGHELAYHPGETNYRMADILVVTKVSSASPDKVEATVANAARLRPGVPLALADLPFSVDTPDLLRGRRALVVEDGPTLTHGGVPMGVAALAALRHGAHLVDPRPYAQGSLKQVFMDFPHLDSALPAMGYSPAQVHDLEATINAIPCDVVVDGTPVTLSRLLKSIYPVINVEYGFEERGDLLASTLRRFFDQHLSKSGVHDGPR